MVRETRMDKSSLILSRCLRSTGKTLKKRSRPWRDSTATVVDRLPYELERLSKAGVSSVMLFGIPGIKMRWGSQAYARTESYSARFARREAVPGPLLHHRRLYVANIRRTGTAACCAATMWKNDGTLELLSKTALSHVQAELIW